jgi:hypothetical protein
MCVREWDREGERKRERLCMCMCVFERKRETFCLCICVYLRERERDYVCVCVCVSEIERGEKNRERLCLCVCVCVRCEMCRHIFPIFEKGEDEKKVDATNFNEFRRVRQSEPISLQNMFFFLFLETHLKKVNCFLQLCIEWKI